MEGSHIKRRSVNFQPGHGGSSGGSTLRSAQSRQTSQTSFSSGVHPSTQQAYSTYTPLNMDAPVRPDLPPSASSPFQAEVREARLSDHSTPPAAAASPPSSRWSGMNRSFTEVSHHQYDSFAKKMGYFRSKGSISLAAPSQYVPSWQDNSHSSLLSSKMMRARSARVLFFVLVTLTGFSVVFLLGRHMISEEAEQALSTSIGGIFPKHYPRFLACEPYSSFGTLAIDQVDPDETRWEPFDKTCKPPQFFRKLRHGDVKGMDWVYNRTVLLIGDTIDREHVEQFCTLMGEKAEVVTEDTHWSAPSSLDRSHGRSANGKHGRGRTARKGVKEGSLPRVCYLPEYNFLLASVYHFGLDQEDFWTQSELYNAPGVFEHRLKDHIEPFTKKLLRERGGRLDLLELSSGSWDLMRWAQQDIDLGQDTAEPLSQERMTWYRFRAGQAMEAVRRAFPSARGKLWRGVHFPTDQAAELEYFKDRIGISRAARDAPAHFSLNRVSQLDQTVRSLVATSKPNTLHLEASGVLHPEYRLNPWATLMIGHAAHQPDRLHGNPGAPATTLWSEVMLYELFRAVSVHDDQQ